MRAYIIRRLLLVIPVVLVVSFIIFGLTSLMPGDAIDAMLAMSGAEEHLDRGMVEHALGLDAPFLVRYGRWLGVVPGMDGSISGLFQGDLGITWRERIPLVERIAQAFPVTLELGLMGIIIAQLIALPIGIYSALRQDKWGDYVARSFAIGCVSFPSFWLGTMIIVYPSIWWGYMPPIMLIHFSEDPIGNLQMFIVPALLLGMALGGMTMRMMRTMMLEVLRQDYIRTAWAKGLKERVVILRHALKNALIPVITVIGFQVPILIGGTVIIEEIFCLPGMGRLLISGVNFRDQPLVSGVLVVFSVAMVLTNLMIDLTYGYLDPRIRYK